MSGILISESEEKQSSPNSAVVFDEPKKDNSLQEEEGQQQQDKEASCEESEPGDLEKGKEEVAAQDVDPYLVRDRRDGERVSPSVLC